MNKHFNKLVHIVLYGGLFLGGLAIFFSRYNAYRQFTIILLTVALYLAWGFVYHHLKGDANNKLMLEYLAIGLLSAFVGFFVLIA